MMDKKEEFNKKLAEIRPDIERLVQKIDENPASCVTGFIFQMHPKGFIRFGNIANRGEELIRLHMVLASLSNEMHEGNPYADVPYAEIGGTDLTPAAPKDDPEAIADALAQEVLISGLEQGYAAHAIELAQKYLIARNPAPQSGGKESDASKT